MSAAVSVVGMLSPLGLGREPVLRREDGTENYLDLPVGDDQTKVQFAVQVQRRPTVLFISGIQPSLGREPVLRREDHLLGKDLDLPGAGDDGDPRVVSGMAEEARLSRTCLSTPASSSSTR